MKGGRNFEIKLTTGVNHKVAKATVLPLMAAQGRQALGQRLAIQAFETACLQVWTAVQAFQAGAISGISVAELETLPVLQGLVLTESEDGLALISGAERAVYVGHARAFQSRSGAAFRLFEIANAVVEAMISLGLRHTPAVADRFRQIPGLTV